MAVQVSSKWFRCDSVEILASFCFTKLDPPLAQKACASTLVYLSKYQRLEERCPQKRQTCERSYVNRQNG
eukprot:5123377-Amphidinium_carterae.1